MFFTRTGLVAVDPASGKVLYQHRWRARQAASVNAATPIVSGDRIFLSASYGTGAVLLQVANNTVKPIWSGDESMSNHYSTSVLKDGYLYGFDGRQEFGQTLRCVELATGKVMWNVDGFGAGTLLIAGDTLVIMRESGELALAPASPKAFRFNARAQLINGVVRAYPALANGRYYVRNDRATGGVRSQQAITVMRQSRDTRLLTRRFAAATALIAPAILAQTTVPEGPIGPSPYTVVRGWHKPFAAPGFAFGGNSGVFAESPDRIFVAQRGEFRLPTPVPPEFAGFAGSIKMNVLTPGRSPRLAELPLHARSQRQREGALDPVGSPLRGLVRTRTASPAHQPVRSASVACG